MDIDVQTDYKRFFYSLISQILSSLIFYHFFLLFHFSSGLFDFILLIFLYDRTVKKNRLLQFLHTHTIKGGATSAFTQQNMLYTGNNSTMIPFNSDVATAVSMGVSGTVQGAVRTPPTLWQYPGKIFVFFKLKFFFLSVHL